MSNTPLLFDNAPNRAHVLHSLSRSSKHPLHILIHISQHTIPDLEHRHNSDKPAQPNRNIPCPCLRQCQRHIPYINVQMQNVPIALEAYTAYLAYSLGGPTSSSVQCPKSGCFNYYSIPVLSSSAGSDFAYACASSGCSTPAANVQLNLYNSKGQLCISTTTDNRGIAHLNLQGPSNCNYPYYYLGTTSTQVVLSELFATEAISSPNPFYTNF